MPRVGWLQSVSLMILQCVGSVYLRKGTDGFPHKGHRRELHVQPPDQHQELHDQSSRRRRRLHEQLQDKRQERREQKRSKGHRRTLRHQGLEEQHKLERASTHYDGFVREQEDDKLLFIGVFSAPGNKQRRQEIRDSWMQDLIFEGDNPIVKAKFVLAQFDQSMAGELAEEYSTYDDMLFLPVTDTYHNLPHKTIAYFRWFARSSQEECGGECSYVMKLDDDTWPNLDLLLPLLAQIKEDKSRPASTLNYIGALLWNGPVVREGKWAETAPLSKFHEHKYPAYMAGSGYIMSTNLVRRLDEHVEKKGITLLRNEDTTIGYWIHTQNHLNFRVQYQDLTWREYGCEEGGHIMMNLCPGEMRCMWEKRLNRSSVGDGASLCCNPPKDYGLPANGCQRDSED